MKIPRIGEDVEQQELSSFADADVGLQNSTCLGRRFGLFTKLKIFTKLNRLLPYQTAMVL